MIILVSQNQNIFRNQCFILDKYEIYLITTSTIVVITAVQMYQLLLYVSLYNFTSLPTIQFIVYRRTNEVNDSFRNE